MHFVCLAIAQGDPIKAADIFENLSEEWFQYWEAYADEMARFRKGQAKR